MGTGTTGFRRLLPLFSAALVAPALGLQYSAMWGLHPGTPDTEGDSPGHTFASLTFDIGNVTQIQQNFERYQTRALFPLAWTAAQPKPCHAPVHHQCTHPPSCNFPCVTIDPNYKASWKEQFAEMQPAIKSGALLGVFLGDEHVYFGMSLGNVKIIADLIRTDWPSAIIYMNEAPDVAMCNYRKDNTTVFGEAQCLPQNVDWFGFDFYSQDSISWTASIEAFQTHVYPRLSRADQRVVPTSLGYSDGSLDVSQASSLDAFCAKNAREFFRWGLSDNRPVMLAPFHWNGGQRKPNGSVVGGAGIIDLPRCAATYRAIGEIVIAAGSEGTTLDPVHRPPTPAPDGSFPEPECGNPIQPAPAAWSWCRREN